MRELTDKMRKWSYVGAPIYRLHVMCYVIGTRSWSIVTVSDTVTTITMNTLPCSADINFEGSRLSMGGGTERLGGDTPSKHTSQYFVILTIHLNK